MIKDKRVGNGLLMIVLWSAYLIFTRTSFFHILPNPERFVLGMTLFIATFSLGSALNKKKELL